MAARSRTYVTFLLLAVPFRVFSGDHTTLLGEALQKAGDNRAQIAAALKRVPADQREGLVFLVENMPERDLTSLSATFLLENTAYAYRVMTEVPWGERIPRAVFLNCVLPYASVTEVRDNWRKDFHGRFLSLVKGCSTPAAAATRLNNRIFGDLKVKYSRRRRRADQGPYESIETGTASCTGLSILLIDACRAVGVPARFAGIQLWPDRSGNHSWVEIWDQGWHFTGAAEPTGDKLNKAWFTGRASSARPDEPRHAIYAVSYKRTPLRFPMVWSRRAAPVYAVNVTERYLTRSKPPAPGKTQTAFRVFDEVGRYRVPAAVTITDARSGSVVFEGTAKDERFDMNDYLTVELASDREYRLSVRHGEQRLQKTITVKKEKELFTLRLPKTVTKQ